MPPVAAMPASSAPSPVQPPGLTALVVYLRPVSRPPVIVPLVELGLFVHEITEEKVPDILSCEVTRPDIVAVVGDTRRDHLQAVRDLARITPAILAIWPDGRDASEVQASGAMAVIADGDTDALPAAVAPVAHLARSLREQRLATVGGPQRVFGSLSFYRGSRRLEGERGAILLPEGDHAVLELLVANMGRPVAAELLEPAAARPDPRRGGETGDGPRVRQTVARLRRKASQLGGQGMLLSSVRGFGYVLNG